MDIIVDRDRFLQVLGKSGSSDNLMAKVKGYKFLFGLLPFVEDVAVCNNVAFGVADDDSDIDLFFILSPRRFYIARMFITFWFQIFGVRRYGKKVAGRFCLSFFVSSENLDFKDVLIERDVYFYYWFYYLTFLKGNLAIQGRLIDDNPWFNEDDFEFENLNFISSGFFARMCEFIFGLILFDWLEILLKNWQLKRAKRKYESLGKPFGVVVKDGFLKFHVVDIRKKFKDEYFSSSSSF